LARFVARERQLKGDTDFADYAAAAWYLTDQNGNGNCLFCADGFAGYHYIDTVKSSGEHAEQKLLTDWLTNGGAAFAVLVSKIARMLNVHAILHIVLFTELPPCDSCQSFFAKTFLPSMAAIATTIMNGFPALDPWPTGETAIQFDVYAKNPAATGGDWRMPISSASDLRFEYQQDATFIRSS